MKRKQISKTISFILRHKPEAYNIKLDEHGWADVCELINNLSENFGLNMELLEEIVRDDEKQRYSFNEDKTKIRANQGHSVSVDIELKEAYPPKILFHGTGDKYTGSIDKKGLLPKSRLYVHLSDNTDTAVKVGARHGKPVVYIVKSREMYSDGYKFYLSENGVWLTETVPPQYLKKQQ